jgi:hypothetical protein
MSVAQPLQKLDRNSPFFLAVRLILFESSKNTFCFTGACVSRVPLDDVLLLEAGPNLSAYEHTLYPASPEVGLPV